MSSYKEKYIAYCLENPALPIFFMPWWLDAVSQKGEWTAIIAQDKNGQTQGVWPLYTEKKLGQLVIKMPALTPYLGPHIKVPNQLNKLNSIYSHNRKILNQLIEQIPDFLYFNVLCHPSFKQLLPLKWKGYKQTNELSYVIEDITDTQKVYDNFASSLRNKISKAEKIFTIEKTEQIEPLMPLLDLTFDKQNLKNNITLDFLKRLTQAIKNNEADYTVIYAKKGDNYVAGNLIVYDKTSAYNLLAGADPNYLKDGAVPLVLWNAISGSSEKVKHFDFEGGLIEPIEVFFRSFGAQQLHYSRFIKTKNVLTDLYLLITGKI